MAFDDFKVKSILDKIVLVEILVGKELTAAAWTQAASGSSVWWTDFDPAYDGEVARVKINNTRLTEVSHIDILEESGSEESWFFDFDDRKLYVRTGDDDNPGTLISSEYKYCIIAYFWACFTNRQPADSPVIYIPQSRHNPAYYLPLLDEQSIGNISQSVGDYYIGSIETQGATLSFLNSGWWWQHIVPGYLWHNRGVYIKVGERGADYTDFATIFFGATCDPQVSDEQASISMRDIRISALIKIPLDFYSADDYPNLDPTKEGWPIPIAFGELTGILPICIDTTIYKYKISGHALNEITAIYLDGVELNSGEYSTDEANGEFTLDDDPGTAEVTCDIQGAFVDFFGGGATYSENVAEILYYVLNTLNGIAKASINLESFGDLRTARTQRIAWYIDEFIDTMDFVRLLQQSALFHLVPLLNGQYGVSFYIGGDSGVTDFYNEDYGALSLTQKTDACFRTVRIKYKKNFTADTWLATEITEDAAQWRYGVMGTLEVETALIDKTEAETLAEVYLLSVRAPQKEITADLPARLLDYLPTDKIRLSKSIEDIEGNEITVFESEVYRILGMDKDLSSCRIETRAADDSQMSGGLHSDVDHADSHIDTHTDVPHTDSGHANYSDHANVSAHSDHANQAAYSDHDDFPYEDWHYDYYDGFYEDYHGDEAHVDAHVDTIHSDSHSNISHSDHSDYEDAEHGNVAYSDVAHADEHGDNPHADSWY